MHRNSLGLLVVLVIFLIFMPILHSLATAKNTQVESALPDAINYLVHYSDLLFRLSYYVFAL